MTRHYFADLDLNNQAINNATGVGGGGGGRELLTANRTYYVDTTGNDSNDGLTPAGSLDVSSLPQSGSISSYWLLDEASGNRSDGIGSNDLTDNNTVTSQAGINGNEAVFVGANSEYLTTSSYTTPAGDFSYSAWITLDSKATYQCIISQYENTTNDRSFLIAYDDVTDRFQVAWSTDGISANTQEANNFGSPSTGVRYLVTTTYNSSTGTMSISVNAGTADSSSGTASALHVSAADLSFGRCDQASPLYFTGKIDEVCYWDGVILSSGEITTLYNSGSGLFPVAGSGTPFLTIQKAIDVAAGLDASIYQITIQIGDGTYNITAPIDLKDPITTSKMIIQGNTGDQTAVVIDGGGTSNNIFRTLGSQKCLVQYVTMQNVAQDLFRVNVDQSSVQIAHCDWSGIGSGFRGIYIVSSECYVKYSGTHNLSDSGSYGSYVLVLAANSHIDTNTANINVSGSPTFTGAFFEAQRLAIMNLVNVTVTGSFTGTGISVQQGSRCFASGATVPGGTSVGTNSFIQT